MCEAPHDDGLARGEALKALQVFRQMPWQSAVATNHIVRRGGNDEADFHDSLELNGNRGTNMRMTFVIQDFEVLVAIFENAIGAAFDRESR